MITITLSIILLTLTAIYVRKKTNKTHRIDRKTQTYEQPKPKPNHDNRIFPYWKFGVTHREHDYIIAAYTHMNRQERSQVLLVMEGLSALTQMMPLPLLKEREQ